MQIEKLRVVNDQLDTNEGTIHGPTSYFMDLNVTEENTVAVPISQETYVSISNIYTQFSPAGEFNTPLGASA